MSVYRSRRIVVSDALTLSISLHKVDYDRGHPYHLLERGKALLKESRTAAGLTTELKI